MATKELIIRVTRYKDYVLFSGLIELIGGKIVDNNYKLPDDYYDIRAELTLEQSVVILESLNGRGRLLAPNKTQA